MVMILVKLLPWVPGHFTWHEWLALALWGVLGAAIRATRQRDSLPEGKIDASEFAPVP